MNKELVYLSEPRLLFGFNQASEDPRDGLTLFGPYESLTGHTIQAGVIGTGQGIEYYKDFVVTLQRPIFTNSLQRPMFPGFESVFGVKWQPTPTLTRIIDNAELESALELPSLKERIYRVVNLILEPIKRVWSEEESKLDIWYIVIPRDVWVRCRPLSEDKKTLPISKQKIKAYRDGQLSLFAEMDEEVSEISEFLDYSSDFHHQLKARLLKEGILIPVQIMLEPTLRFKDKYTETDYSQEMRAHLAWTQSSAVYYKLGKLPWKLHDIRRGVCYVGMVFKQFERFDTRGYVCSAAQMFLDSGDGTIFRGNVGPWKSKSSDEYHLDKASANELLAKALRSYHDKKGCYPEEMFIHGRAAFSDEEWQGFSEAVNAVSNETRLVGVSIRESEKLKLFRDVSGEDSKFGNLRGLALPIDDYEGYLWSRGFVPRLYTSMSLEVPTPLRIQVVRGRAEIQQVMQDILALTKLNYNACIYGDGLPVTVRFSDVIGNILTAVDGLTQEILPFKYYI